MSSTKDKLVGHLLGFRKEDDVMDLDVLVEVTDHVAGGTIEVAFDVPVEKVDRLYLRLNVPDLVRIALSKPETNG